MRKLTTYKGKSFADVSKMIENKYKNRDNQIDKRSKELEFTEYLIPRNDYKRAAMEASSEIPAPGTVEFGNGPAMFEFGNAPGMFELGGFPDVNKGVTNFLDHIDLNDAPEHDVPRYVYAPNLNKSVTSFLNDIDSNDVPQDYVPSYNIPKATLPNTSTSKDGSTKFNFKDWFTGGEDFLNKVATTPGDLLGAIEPLAGGVLSMAQGLKKPEKAMANPGVNIAKGLTRSMGFDNQAAINAARYRSNAYKNMANQSRSYGQRMGNLQSMYNKDVGREEMLNMQRQQMMNQIKGQQAQAEMAYGADDVRTYQQNQAFRLDRERARNMAGNLAVQSLFNRLPKSMNSRLHNEQIYEILSGMGQNFGFTDFDDFMKRGAPLLQYIQAMNKE